jgi:hypothetical protein
MMEDLKYQKVFTERLMIKDNVFRSVQVRPNGNANWVIKYGDKLVNVTGKKVGDRFVANEKFSHVVESYTPKRISRKPNGIVKKVILNKKGINADCFYMGEKRRVAFYSPYRRIGRINFRGQVIKVKVDENMIAVKYEV